MIIGIIAGSHDEFELWISRNILAPNPQRAYSDVNVYHFGELTVRYIPQVDRARGIEFAMIICIGTFYRRWSQDSLDQLRAWTKITQARSDEATDK